MNPKLRPLALMGQLSNMQSSQRQRQDPSMATGTLSSRSQRDFKMPHSYLNGAPGVLNYLVNRTKRGNDWISFFISFSLRVLVKSQNVKRCSCFCVSFAGRIVLILYPARLLSSPSKACFWEHSLLGHFCPSFCVNLRD